VAYFYNYSLNDLSRMDALTFNKHVVAMERIEAMNHLKELKVSDFPQMKSDARDKYHRQISKKAFPNRKVSSFDDIDKAFGVLGGK
jgi:hypothetical protein